VIDQLMEDFKLRYGGNVDEVRAFFAPGRVNLIGEHTDYNGGYVFPAALSVGTWALARPRQDGIYQFASNQFDGKIDCSISNVIYKKEDDWANYPKGVLHQLLSLFKATGGAPAPATESLKGADILFHGNIPNGAGLSSSASIELVTALAMTKLASLEVPMLELVKLSQRVENQFIGVNCGIMDQFAVGMGKKDHAMILKCNTLEHDYVPFKNVGYKLVITNTNKRRGGLADTKYNERRRECEEGLRIIQSQYPHITSLGDLRYDEWKRIREVIPSDVIRNRVEHVISEDERVILATESLPENDLLTFGQLMKKSHESLRDLYEVTGFELDTLFEEASKAEGCIGTRMTGAGFGGCNVSLVKEDHVEAFKETVANNYTAKTGLVPTFYVCDIGDGAREITEEVGVWQF
jgi:galactokinase